MIENQNDVRIGVVVSRDGDEGNELFQITDISTNEEPLQCKAAGDANWHPAVMYQSMLEGDTAHRVRPLVDFCSKFSIQTPESV